MRSEDAGLLAGCVDAHVHVVVDNPDYHYPRDFPVEALVERMDAAGVRKAVIVQSKSGNGLDNPYPCAAARRYPGRFVAVCGVQALSDTAGATIRSRVADWGARGVRLFGGSAAMSDPSRDPIWTALCDLDVPVLLGGQVDFDQATRVLDRFPALRVVLDHLGRPDLGHGLPYGLLRMADRGGVVMKFTSYVIDEAEKAGAVPADVLAAVIAVFGADRVMWGSNYPSSFEPRWSYQNSIDTAMELLARYPLASRERILGGTAISLWPELGDAAP